MRKLILCMSFLNPSFVVEFFEPKNKQPVPLEKVRLYFRIHKKFAKDKYSKEITFNIENEAVNYKLFEICMNSKQYLIIYRNSLELFRVRK